MSASNGVGAVGCLSFGVSGVGTKGVLFSFCRGAKSKHCGITVSALHGRLTRRPHADRNNF